MVEPMQDSSTAWVSTQAKRAAAKSPEPSLGTRRRAQGGAAAAPFVPASATSDSARLTELEKGPVEQLRQAAEQELNRTKAAFQEAKGLAWTAYLSLPLLVLSKITADRRWSPIAQLIEDSEKSLAAGDQAASEPEKRRSYAAAWSSARIAQGAILREAGEGKTGVTAILKQEARVAGVDPDQVTDAARQAGKKVTDAAEGLGSLLKWTVVGIGLYGGVKLLGGLRG